MGDHWAWEAKELNPQEPFNKTTLPSHRESVWLLKSSIIGNYCIPHPKDQFSILVGDLIYLGQSFTMTLSGDSVVGDSPSHGAPAPPAG
jgi:hypothetical protein